MVEITKSNLGRRVNTRVYTGTIIGGNKDRYLISRDDLRGWANTIHFDTELLFGSFTTGKNNWWLDADFEFIDEPKSIFKPGDKVFITGVHGDHPVSDIGKQVTLSRTWREGDTIYWNYKEDVWNLKESNISTHAPMQSTPSFKFNIGDTVVLNNRGHQTGVPAVHDKPYTSCKSDNAFAFESGAKIIYRNYYPKEGRNWYQIEHNGKIYDNWISEDGLELFVAKPAELYTYKVGDVIRFKDTPNTRSYRSGISIGKTYTITGKEELKSINNVEKGSRDCWCTDGNEWGTNFRKGDIELVGEFGAESGLILPRSIVSCAGLFTDVTVPEKSVQPSSTDIVYISKQKTKHKLLTF